MEDEDLDWYELTWWSKLKSKIHGLHIGTRWEPDAGPRWWRGLVSYTIGYIIGPIVFRRWSRRVLRPAVRRHIRMKELKGRYDA